MLCLWDRVSLPEPDFCTTSGSAYLGVFGISWFNRGVELPSSCFATLASNSGACEQSIKVMIQKVSSNDSKPWAILEVEQVGAVTWNVPLVVVVNNVDNGGYETTASRDGNVCPSLAAHPPRHKPLLPCCAFKLDVGLYLAGKRHWTKQGPARAKISIT